MKAYLVEKGNTVEAIMLYIRKDGFLVCFNVKISFYDQDIKLLEISSKKYIINTSLFKPY